MEKKTKFMIICFGVIPALLGIFIALSGKYLSAEMQLFIIGVIVISEAFIIRKFFAKELKSDELQKKIAIMSDAVAGRAAVFSLWGYWFADMTGILKNFPTLPTITWVMILFGIIVISASIAGVYYSKNPHKLP